MKTKRAAVALSTILIIIGLLTISGTLLVLEGIDATQNTTTTVDYSVATTHIDTCKEEAARRVTFNPAYTGNETVIINGSSCDFTVSDTGANTKQVDVVVTNNDVSVEGQFQIDTSTMPITVTVL